MKLSVLRFGKMNSMIIRLNCGRKNITDQGIRPLLKGTITDKEVITSIVNTIKECNENKIDDINSYLSDYDKGLASEESLMSDNGEYKLKLIFADGQALNLDKNSLDITLKKIIFILISVIKEILFIIN